MVLAMSVMPSARMVTVLLRMLSTSISSAVTLRMITLASPPLHGRHLRDHRVPQ